jgi:hypothetical protein
MFRLLGLHPGVDIGLPAAAVLSDTPVREARELLDQLASAHLLNQPRADRYQFHDLLRVYAAERAELEHSEPECEASLRRLLDWYLRAVAEANNWVRPDLLTEDVVLPAPSGPEVSFSDYDDDRLVRRRAGHPRGARIRCGAAWLVLPRLETRVTAPRPLCRASRPG